MPPVRKPVGEMTVRNVKYPVLFEERERFEESYKFDDLDGDIEAEIERIASEEDHAQ